MNQAVEKLFGRLQSPDSSGQSTALAQLAMLFDKNGTGLQDDVWGVVLTDDLMRVRLSEVEIRELKHKLIAIAKSSTFSRSAYLSLVGIIIKNSAVEDTEQVFAFFSEVAVSPDEDVYGVLAEFGQFLTKVKDGGRLQQMADKFDTVNALVALQEMGSKRLKESALRTINFLKEPPTVAV
jgi:hypothetical protein